ncbi:hypothetical protein NDU88_007375 [Pleurodeles waltl]|uniref:Uncharacterized protein n=1 Tax=Pleurodeles waltl TaxID=8319 RepID=A0AAV7NUN0_PLEWA|nr:hypothetical protein NDU88_007375 [Pleurodeles waltl]
MSEQPDGNNQVKVAGGDCYEAEDANIVRYWLEEKAASYTDFPSTRDFNKIMSALQWKTYDGGGGDGEKLGVSGENMEQMEDELELVYDVNSVELEERELRGSEYKRHLNGVNVEGRETTGQKSVFDILQKFGADGPHMQKERRQTSDKRYEEKEQRKTATLQTGGESWWSVWERQEKLFNIVNQSIHVEEITMDKDGVLGKSTNDENKKEQCKRDINDTGKNTMCGKEIQSEKRMIQIKKMIQAKKMKKAKICIKD